MLLYKTYNVKELLDKRKRKKHEQMSGFHWVLDEPAMLGSISIRPTSATELVAHIELQSLANALYTISLGAEGVS